jgi:hypothetical protein
MKKPNNKGIVCMLILACCLSLLSATRQVASTQPLSQEIEAQIVGAGDSECNRAWGLGIALAVASLSPCSVVCAALAWYDLALIEAYC